MPRLLTRVEIIVKIPELKTGKNFWYWAMKAKVDYIDKKAEGGNVTYYYSPEAVDKIKAVLGVK